MVCILLRESSTSLENVLKNERLEMTERVMEEKAPSEAEAKKKKKLRLWFCRTPLSPLCTGLVTML